MQQYNEKIKIAAAGRTNVGKTTLIRTLTKTEFGKIGDEANTTQQEEIAQYDSLQAVFIDPPGFVVAGMYRNMRAMFKNTANKAIDWAGFKKQFSSDVKLEYDERAANALEKADVVMYVASVADDVPNASHEQELELVKSIQPKIIGLINKYGEVYKSNPDKAEERLKKWKEDFFLKNGINNFVVFDAHWDKPSAVSDLYNLIYEVLETEKKDTFMVGLDNFKKQQKETKQRICNYLAETIILCKNIEESAESKAHELDEGKAKRYVLDKLSKRIDAEILKFTQKAKDIYFLSSHPPTIYSEDISPKFTISKDQGESNVKVGTHGTVGGIIGGLIGGFIGSLILPGPGTAVGAKLGAVLGGAGGVVSGANKEVNKFVSAHLTDDGLQLAFDCCIAVVWAFSFQGFGKDSYVEERVINELRKRVKEADFSKDKISLTSATREQIAKKAEQVLDNLENIPPPNL